MKQTNILLLVAILLCGYQTTKAQCGGSIDFSTDWAKKGPAAAGTWTVSGGGSTVTQTINGAPTFYVSGTNYIDVRISGTFQVNTTGDDDWVGFVFGYQYPNIPADEAAQKYYLFDWKQTNQPGTGGSCYTLAEEGFSLVEVDTSVDLNNECALAPMYWDHNSYPGFNVLATDYSTTNGWVDLVEYDFTLTYTSSVIIIEIEGDTIFNLPGCYEPGRFGFYNLSQNNSVYSNFSYELIADFDMSVTDACINEDVDFDAINNFCQAGSYISPITGWSWDLGDGTTIVDTNITYQYSEPGIYTIELSVSDDFGCISTISQDIEIKGLIAGIDDAVICPSGSTEVWCNLADDGALYQWFLDGAALTSPTLNDTDFTATTAGNYQVVMTGYDAAYSPCNTSSNMVNLVIDNANITLSAPDGTTICSGGSVDLTCNTISGATQYEWFLDGISQGTGTTNFTASTIGNYQVVVTTANGCDFASNIIALISGTNPNATISASVNDICPGETSDLSTSLLSGETAQWYLNGNPIGGATNANYTANAAGNYHIVITNSAGCSDVSSTENIILNPVPSPSISSSEPNFCPGVTDILLTASPSGAASYQWVLGGSPIGGATSSTYNTTAAGNYQVTVTNAQGCSATSSTTTLQVGTVSTFNLTSDVTEFCDGSTANLSVNLESGSVYQWFYNGSSMGAGVANQNTKIILNGGDYYVIVTNALGCTSQSNTITVDENPLPTSSISASSLSFCAGGSTLITANFISGATYEWFLNGSSLGAATINDNTITASAIGNYYVQINDGCSANSNTLNITQQPLPSAAGPISGATNFCPGESFTYVISTVANASSYNWVITPASAASIGSGQGTNNVIINTTNQNFTISVTPQNGCGNGSSSNLAVNVNSAFMCNGQILFAANKTNVCQGSQVIFTNYTDGSVFFGTTPEWSFGPGASPATAIGNGPHTVTYSTSGLKTVTLEYVDDFSGFVVADEVKINYINVNGSVSTSTITGNNLISCAGGVENYSVTNTTGSTYNWTVPGGATILSGQGSNAISVNFNGTEGNVTVTETTSAGCAGAPVNFTVTISNAANTSDITGATTLQCDDNSEIYSVTGSVGSTFNWFVPPGAIIVNGQGTDEIEVNFNGYFGTVSVQETNSAGCFGTAQTIDVTCVNALGENTTTTLTVYPNPAHEFIQMSVAFEGDVVIRVYDSSGKLIRTQSENADSNLQINVSDLSRGIYFGELSNNGKIYRFKFSKN